MDQRRDVARPRKKLSPSEGSEKNQEGAAAKPLEDGPGVVALPEPETDEKAITAKFLAIHDFPTHGSFPLHGSNLGLLAKLPRGRCAHADAVRTEVVGIGSLPSLGSPLQRPEVHLHHDREPFFFPAIETAFFTHAARAFPGKPACGLH
jgi:hypothetical protein